jgi:hypothetical protein
VSQPPDQEQTPSKKNSKNQSVAKIPAQTDHPREMNENALSDATITGSNIGFPVRRQSHGQELYRVYSDPTIRSILWAMDGTEALRGASFIDCVPDHHSENEGRTAAARNRTRSCPTA